MHKPRPLLSTGCGLEYPSPRRQMHSTHLSTFQVRDCQAVMETPGLPLGTRRKASARAAHEGGADPGPQDKCPLVSGPLLTLPRTSPFLQLMDEPSRLC